VTAIDLPKHLAAEGCDEADVPMDTARSPSRNTPSAGLNTVRWQVSRLAEQDFVL